MLLSAFETILVVLALTIFAMIICRYARLPTILGYLIIGVLVGPNGIGWLHHIDKIQSVAEFGVVFLMFMVGLEFSFNKLMTMRHSVFILGGLQVILTIAIMTIIGMVFKMSFLQSIVISGIIAMSSTAIVLKYLSDQSELDKQYAINSVGILLFQDLAVIPFFIVITALSSTTQLNTGYTISWSLLKGVCTVGAMFVIGRWLLRPLFHFIIHTRIRELFTLTALLVTLFCAWFTHEMGLSLSLGAFIGGMLLSESKFRHQIEIEIRPFRDIFMGIFFISIGLLLNISSWAQSWMWILLMLVGIIVGKSCLIVFLSRVLGYDKITAFRTGIMLSQGSEFGFAILTLALQYSILPDNYAQAILGALILSFAVAPIIIQYSNEIIKLIFPQIKIAPEQAVIPLLKNKVVICGFGRVGQNLARLLKHEKCNYIAVDNDPKIIHSAQLAGEPVVYGDVTHPDILKVLHLTEAKILVISFCNVRNAMKILDQVRVANSKLPILVRCRDDAEYKKLKLAGATHVVAETFEESLTMASHLLQQIHIPTHKISQLIHQIRTKQYNILREVFRGSVDYEAGEIENEYLQPVLLVENAKSINKNIKDFNLDSLGVSVVSIKRGAETMSYDPEMKLNLNDILILFGTSAAIKEAESKLI